MIDDELEELTERKTAGPGRKKWLLRILAIVGISLVALVIFRWQLGRQNEKTLTNAVNEISLAEQNWKLEDIEAERLARSPPPDRDAAKLVLEIADQIPEEWNE